jgi:hypothetical protein
VSQSLGAARPRAPAGLRGGDDCAAAAAAAFNAAGIQVDLDLMQAHRTHQLLRGPSELH